MTDQWTSHDGDFGVAPTLDEQNANKERSGNAVRAALILVVLVGMGFLMRLLAYGFPDHPKTLARDAVVSGFAGGVLVVQELVRELVRDLASIADVLAGALVSLLATVVADFVVKRLGIPWYIFLIAGLVGGFVLGVVIAFVRAGLEGPIKKVRPAFAAFWTRVGPPLTRSGPVVLGFLLLLLSMFLQLRAINLGEH